MARTHTDPDGIGEVIELFPQGSRKAVERVLARARAKEATQAGYAVQQALRGTAMPNLGMGRLLRELGRALSHRSAEKGRVSIRQAAPGTGGRPFHFAHSVVGKTDGSGSASAIGHKANPCTAGSTGAGATREGPSGRAAAHMRYIERERAVERRRDQDGRSAGLDDPERDGLGEDRERDPAQAVRTTGAGAGQGYVENPVKLENGEFAASSFGTIGEHHQDRVAFWDALEQAEAHPDARVQHRLILELPHEASPAARLEMVQRFCRRFENDGIPFWAALHAPGEKNDSRNFHAHIVYSERPAQRMPHPDRPDETVWDFEVVKAWTDSSRHARTSRPFRQNKLRAYSARGFIPARRKEFADIVNDVLRRDAVKDHGGAAVLYDERSYAAMGLDVVPMRAINRIVVDRARDGATTVLDAGYTRRVIAEELRAAAARRDKGVVEVLALDHAMRAATGPLKAGHAREASSTGRLPLELRSLFLRSVSRKELKVAGDSILAARREALMIDVMERTTTAALDRIVEATDPELLAATARGKAGKAATVPVDAEAARLLREAALEELAEVRKVGADARRRARLRIAAANRAWREVVDAPLTETSASTKRVLRGLDDAEQAGPPLSLGTPALVPAYGPSSVTGNEATTGRLGVLAAAKDGTDALRTGGSAIPADDRAGLIPDGEPAAAPRPRKASVAPVATAPVRDASTLPEAGQDLSAAQHTPQTPRESTAEQAGGSEAPGPMLPAGSGARSARPDVARTARKAERADVVAGGVLAHLAEADKRISGLIKAVMDIDPDPDVRWGILESVIEDWKNHIHNKRSMADAAGIPRPGAPAAAARTPPTGSRAEAAARAETTASPPGSGPSPGAARADGERSPVADPGRNATVPAPDIEGEEVMPRSTKDRQQASERKPDRVGHADRRIEAAEGQPDVPRVSENEPAHTGFIKAGVEPETDIATGAVLGGQSVDVGPTASKSPADTAKSVGPDQGEMRPDKGAKPSGESAPVEGDPDDMRRKRKHDEEKERRKKRKAVLGRKNKPRKDRSLGR